jgi:hypothetical protein
VREDRHRTTGIAWQPPQELNAHDKEWISHQLRLAGADPLKVFPYDNVDTYYAALNSLKAYDLAEAGRNRRLQQAVDTGWVKTGAGVCRKSTWAAKYQREAY